MPTILRKHCSPRLKQNPFTAGKKARRNKRRRKIAIAAESIVQVTNHFLARKEERGINSSLANTKADVVRGIMQGRVEFDTMRKTYRVIGNLARYIVNKDLTVITTYKKDKKRQKEDARIYRPITREERIDLLKIEKLHGHKFIN